MPSYNSDEQWQSQAQLSVRHRGFADWYGDPLYLFPENDALSNAVKTPDKAGRWMMRYDAGFHVEPFSFVLEVPA